MTGSPESVLVTGAGGGLGSAIARRFAGTGATVVCVDRDLDAAERTARDVAAAGGAARAVGADITEEPHLIDIRARLKDRGELPRCVINAAGILTRGQMASTDAEAFRRVIDVNVTGPYVVTRTFADDLIASGRGRVINVGSIAGTMGYPFPAYASSKAALINLTRSLLVDFWGTGVTANAVCPGAMDTPMLDRSAIAAIRRKTPTRRVVTPEEVAASCVFLASEDASGINGQSVVIDGGATAIFRYTDEEQA